MKISLSNFKAIEDIKDFDLKGINIIAGENSGGKSSLLQAFLLIKQTIESQDRGNPLKLNKPYVALGKYREIVNSNKNNFSFRFSFTEKDFKARTKRLFSGKYGNEYKSDINTISLQVTFEYQSNRVYVKSLGIKLSKNDIIKNYIEFKRHRGYKYDISCSSSIFFYNSNKVSQIERGELRFRGFFPESIECDGRLIRLSPLIQETGILLEEFVSSIQYIGPLREPPKQYYMSDDESTPFVGTKGEYTPSVLAKRLKDKIKYHQINFTESGGVAFPSCTDTLEAATKYWICDFFEMAKNIHLKKHKDGVLYSIQLTKSNNHSSSILHMGFGISQILPIVVQGLLLTEGDTLILEQPEIHLHPKVQSKLYDFLCSLQAKGIRTIVETHSDHLITRLRLRAAQTSDEETLNKDINLIFVQSEEGKAKYNFLELNEMGNLAHWPKGFFDQYENDLALLVNAQIARRKSSKALIDAVKN